MKQFTSIDKENERLAQRVLTCLPAATFDMETLIRLAGLQVCRDIPTAAIECNGRPRMLVNPDFVEAYCRRDEHLFLLVMHELWHVILAHTRLYPRLTLAENIAFDAVINAGLAREFSGPEYRGFMEIVNAPDLFPGLLLRPPEGWPDRPVYPDDGPPGTLELLQRLYPVEEIDQVPMPLYSEILELLHRGLVTIDVQVSQVLPDTFPGAGRAMGGSRWDEPFLLGDHLSGEEHGLEDTLLNDVIRRIVACWPPPPFPLGGRDAGGRLNEWQLALAPVPGDVRRTFARVLRSALGPVPGSPIRRTPTHILQASGRGVLPNAADRLAPALRSLGIPHVLWQQSRPVRVRRRESKPRAHVYLDVSGSMQELLPYLAGLLVPYVAGGRARIYQFSTEVELLPLDNLRRGDFRSTGGTDIKCVLEHLLSEPRIGRALLLSDGYTGEPHYYLANQLNERGFRMHLVLANDSPWKQDLENFAASFTILPPLRPERRPWRVGL